MFQRKNKTPTKYCFNFNRRSTGMENDRVLRTQSYVKDFKRITFGTINLNEGKGILTLKALDIPGSQAMDFRLLMFKRI